jgi:hypothetical protein
MFFALQRPTLTFVIVFLTFSLLFLSNTFKLWFKTDQYYEEMRDSLTRMPIPFRSLFLARLDDRERWLARQKAFSLIGVAAVLFADVMVVMAWLN